MELQPIHDEPTSFVKKYLFTIDHKIIAKQFLWAGLIFLAFGGALAMLIRWQWAFPGQPVPVFGSLFLSDSGGVITPAVYTQLFTNHGLIMVFWAITPLIIGCFGNLVIPLQIGARDMAFPLLNMLSFWVFLLSQILVISSFFMQLGAAAAGWTTYAPLSTHIGTPGAGQTLMVLAIFVVGVSSIMGGINYVITVIRLRAPGMTYMRLPLTIWGLWLTSILNVLFVPVLGSAGLMIVLDRVAGTQFFIAGANGNGDPILFQHLFWIFGHPEVYILILPAWGIVGDLVSFFSRKPHYWYRGSVYSMVTVTVLSAVVYGHHMYETGMNPMLGKTFMILTLIISIPAEVLFLNWLHTMWKGSMRLTTPMLFALGTIFVFGLGGLTGISLGTISTDIYLHDTMYVVGHFHFTMGSASFLATFAGIYFWFPKMYGTMMDEKMGRAHFWLSIVFITILFGGQLVVGWSGQQRRLFDPYQYHYIEHLLGINRISSYAAFALGASQILFVVNFFQSIFSTKKAEKNPWQVTTLEWTLTSPPPHYNFKEIPTVHRGPHEFANPAVQEVIGRDWLEQTEPLPEGIEEPLGAELPQAAQG